MELKTDVESLAQCLSQHTDYLKCSKKRAMTNLTLNHQFMKTLKILTFSSFPFLEQKGLPS